MKQEKDAPAGLKKDFIAALRIIYREGLSDAFAHLSARVADGKKMLFMPRKSPALVKANELFVVDFEKIVPQSTLHQAIYKVRDDVRSVIHFHSPAVILLSVVGETVRPDAQLQRDLLRRRAALPRHRTSGIARAGGRNCSASRFRQGGDLARSWCGGGWKIGPRSLHAGALPRGVGTPASGSNEARCAEVCPPARGRTNRQTHFQARVHRASLGTFPA